MQKLKLAVFVIILLLAVGCGAVPAEQSAPPVEQPASPQTYTVVNAESDVTATITWNGTAWACSTVPEVDGTPCAQATGFFYHSQKIGTPHFEGGKETGRIDLEPGWSLAQ